MTRAAFRFTTPAQRARERRAARELAAELVAGVPDVSPVVDTMGSGVCFFAGRGDLKIAVIVAVQDKDGPVHTYEPRRGT